MPLHRRAQAAGKADPARTLGLVVEGGGCRGIYAAGVLDMLLEAKLRVGSVLGVSAGAIHGASYVSGQQGRSLRFYSTYCKDPRFFSLRRWLRTGNLIDPDFCYKELPLSLDPFDEAAFERSPTAFYATASNLETGAPEYLLLTDLVREIDGLMASASLPYFSPIVHFRGMKLLDGGCTDRVPLAAAEALGHRRSIVVLTHPAEHRVRDFDALAARWVYRRYPAFVRAFEASPVVYEATQRLIAERERAGSVFVFRPSAPIGIGRMTHDAAAIRRAYDQGRREAEALRPAFEAWLSSSEDALGVPLRGG